MALVCTSVHLTPLVYHTRVARPAAARTTSGAWARLTLWSRLVHPSRRAEEGQVAGSAPSPSPGPPPGGRPQRGVAAVLIPGLPCEPVLQEAVNQVRLVPGPLHVVILRRSTGFNTNASLVLAAERAAMAEYQTLRQEVLRLIPASALTHGRLHVLPTTHPTPYDSTIAQTPSRDIGGRGPGSSRGASASSSSDAWAGSGPGRRRPSRALTIRVLRLARANGLRVVVAPLGLLRALDPAASQGISILTVPTTYPPRPVAPTTHRP